MTDAKYIVISVDCPDRFNFELRDGKYKTICEGEQTYIPEWLPCATSDSELMIVIDLETGQIVDWLRPHKEDIDKTIEEYKSED